MHPDLVGSTRDRPAGEQGVIAKAFANFKERLGFLALVTVHAHLSDVNRMRSERFVDVERGFRRAAMDQRRVCFLGLVGAEKIAQSDQDGLGLGQQNDAARLEIQPVGVRQILQLPGPGPGLALDDAAVQQLHQVGPVGIVAVGRGEQAGRFVQRQQMLVFKQNFNFPELTGGRSGELDGVDHGCERTTAWTKPRD